jgi:hypothetical protein
MATHPCGCSSDAADVDSDASAGITLSAIDWHAPPMEGLGAPVTSNDPEEFHGDGLLFGTGNAGARRPTDPATGAPQTVPLERFGIYLHHINKSRRESTSASSRPTARRTCATR